jgi:carboxypeptidase C (cathepsin A)
MHKCRRIGWLLALALVGVVGVGGAGAGPAWARQPVGPDLLKDQDKPKPAEAYRPSVSEHEVTIGGAKVRYRVTAGLWPLMDDQLKAKARVFCVSYERLADGPVEGDAPRPTLASKDPAKRAVTFAFNGGPGSSSVWLHLGALGPRRVVMGPEGERLPTQGLRDNAFSWLDFTDLVFIDPVSTGFSRALEGEDPKQFHGLDEDVRWVAEFIRLHLVRSQRWLSPKFLAGESYGTTRAAGLASELQGKLGINLSGIVLISPVLNFQTLSFDTGNDTPYWLFLPTYTATAFHHGRLAPPLNEKLERTIEQVQAWASSEYLMALAQGDALAPAKRDQIAERLAAFTGLSVDYVKRANLRVPIFAFTKELLREQGRTVGRLDSRYVGIDRNQNGASTEFDPSYAAIQGPYTAALNAYVRGELKFESDLNYEILTGNVQPWNYGPARNRYADVAESLRSAMSQNTDLRVLACSGYFDLATPFYAMTYTMTHMGLDPKIRGNIRQTFYPSGHMMYVREADLEKLKVDVAGFYSENPALR